jgi:hypothetical protein
VPDRDDGAAVDPDQFEYQLGPAVPLQNYGAVRGVQRRPDPDPAGGSVTDGVRRR